MVDQNLIDHAYLTTVKQISPSAYTAKIDQIIREVQENEVKAHLGRELYYSIVRDELFYSDLLNGVDYLDCGKTYRNPGLKRVIAEYAYAHLVMFGDIINNPFGFTKKLTSDGQNLDYSEKKTFYNKHRQLAYDLWLEVRRYILYKKYPYFICNSTNSTLKIYKIGQ